jgi:hypothetical protein
MLAKYTQATAKGRTPDEVAVRKCRRFLLERSPRCSPRPKRLYDAVFPGSRQCEKTGRAPKYDQALACSSSLTPLVRYFLRPPDSEGMIWRISPVNGQDPELVVVFSRERWRPGEPLGTNAVLLLTAGLRVKRVANSETFIDASTERSLHVGVRRSAQQSARGF